MKSKWVVFILSLIVIAIVSGCIDQSDKDGIKYSNDALILDGYKTQTRVFPNQDMFIEFWLTNQVENEVKNVDVKFFNPSVFKIIELKCGEDDVIGDTCHFDEIKSLNAKIIHAGFKVPSEEEIGELGGTHRIQFSVEYDYDGESVLYFRILNVEEESTETRMRTTQTTGPVHLEIEPGFIIEVIEDSQKKTISDWVIEGMSFSVKVTGENVGKLGSGYEYPDIDIDDFNITLKNVNVNESDIDNCDFNVTDNILKKDDITISKKEEFRPLICILTPREGFPEPEIPGIIKADYSYKYEFVKTEKIKIETV